MRTMVVAPHPDDETLGCGGTLLRSSDEGHETSWVLVTDMATDLGFTAEAVTRREVEIDSVADAYGFTAVHRLGFPTTRLDTVPLSTLVSSLANCFSDFEPEQLLLPWPGDVHSDHRITYEASVSASKSFRLPSVRRWLTYETLSETEAALPATAPPFDPNVFVDITGQLDRKLDILATYQSEVAPMPFPRSSEAVRALATFRGITAGFDAAEGFMVLRERR